MKTKIFATIISGTLALFILLSWRKDDGNSLHQSWFSEDRHLRGETVLYAQIQRFSGNSLDSSINPKGVIKLIFHPYGKSFQAQYHFVKLEDSCQDRYNVMSCNIDIRSGTSCDDEESIGVQFFDPQKTWGNPFHTGATKYISFRSMTRGKFGLYTGYGNNDNLGRVVMITASDGTLIGCGVLKQFERVVQVEAQADLNTDFEEVQTVSNTKRENNNGKSIEYYDTQNGITIRKKKRKPRIGFPT